MKEKIYISGKITGLPKKVYTENFDRVEAYLSGVGFEAVNPVKLITEKCMDDATWADMMIECLKALKECNSIYLLRDYRKSKGAILERRFAKALGLRIIHEG